MLFLSLNSPLFWTFVQKPFLDKISDLDKMSDLTDEVESVLSEADNLEEYLKSLVSSVGGEVNIYQQHMVPYQIIDFSGISRDEFVFC